MGRSFCIAVVALALPALAAASTQRTISYRIVAASASAHLSYSGETADQAQRVAGTADASARRSKLRGKAAARRVSLKSGQGRVFVTVATKRSERAKLSQRSAPTQPYVEQTCRNSRSRTGSAGVVLSRIGGGRILARWAFPDANALTCPGPSRVGKRLASKMVRTYPAAHFDARRVTVTLSGSAPFKQGIYKGVYRWRASVTLART